MRHEILMAGRVGRGGLIKLKFSNFILTKSVAGVAENLLARVAFK